MSDLTHLFTIGQPVRCRLDEKYYKGTVKETYPDHSIEDIPKNSILRGFVGGSCVDV